MALGHDTATFFVRLSGLDDDHVAAPSGFSFMRWKFHATSFHARVPLGLLASNWSWPEI